MQIYRLVDIVEKEIVFIGVPFKHKLTSVGKTDVIMLIERPLESDVQIENCKRSIV